MSSRTLSRARPSMSLAAEDAAEEALGFPKARLVDRSPPGTEAEPPWPREIRPERQPGEAHRLQGHQRGEDPAVVLALPHGKWTAPEPRTPTTATEPHTEALGPARALQPGTRELAHRMEVEAAAHPNSVDSTPLLLAREHPPGVVVVVVVVDLLLLLAAVQQQLVTAHPRGLLVRLL